MSDDVKKDPIKWVDLDSLIRELKKIKRILDKGQEEKAKKAFNLNVVYKKDLDSFDLKEIKKIIEKDYLVLMGIYNSMKNLPHKGSLEFNAELGADLVNLFTRLGR